MAVTYGFYNSYNHDRLYSAEQVGSIFDGLIADGVYAQYGNAFNVVPRSGMSVYVQSGRAWIAHTWTLNDSDDNFWITLNASDSQYPRKDAIVLRVHKTNRKNEIIKKTGTPAASPQNPALTKTDTVIEYPLAYITVPRNATEITSANIDYRVGKSDCPFIVHLLSHSQTITSYINQFTADMQAALDEWKTEVLAQIADEYTPDDPEDDLGYAASITNLQQGLAKEVKDRKTAINGISGSGGAIGGAIATHNTSSNPHNNVIGPVKTAVNKLEKTTVPAVSNRVTTIENIFSDNLTRYKEHWHNLNNPLSTICRFDIGSGTTGSGKPSATKMGDYIMVFTMTTNPNAKYNVQVAFGLKNTVAMRCKNGKTTWGNWTYSTFK